MKTNFKLLFFISSFICYVCVNVLFLFEITAIVYQEYAYYYWIAYGFSVLGFVFSCLGFSNKYKHWIVTKIMHMASKDKGLANDVDYGNYPNAQYKVFDYTNLFLFLISFLTLFIAIIAFKFSI